MFKHLRRSGIAAMAAAMCLVAYSGSTAVVRAYGNNAATVAAFVVMRANLVSSPQVFRVLHTLNQAGFPAAALISTGAA